MARVEIDEQDVVLLRWTVKDYQMALIQEADVEPYLLLGKYPGQESWGIVWRGNLKTTLDHVRIVGSNIQELFPDEKLRAQVEFADITPSIDWGIEYPELNIDQMQKDLSE